MFDAVTYFEDIAKKLKEIKHTATSKHFFRGISVSRPLELINNLSIAQYPALVVIDRQDGRINDNNSDNLLDKKLYGYMILKPAADNSPTVISAVQADCKVIFRKITSRMRRDYKADNKLAITDAGVIGLRNLECADIAYQTVGPLQDNLYGLYVTFSINDPFGAKYDANDWEE